MRGNRLEFISGKADGRDRLLADQSVGHFLEDRLFGWTRVATESGFDRIEVFHQQVAEGGAGGENRIGSEHLLLIDDVDLGISFLLCLDELVRLIESGVFDVVFAKSDARYAKEADFHSLCLHATAQAQKLFRGLTPFLKTMRLRPGSTNQELSLLCQYGGAGIAASPIWPASRHYIISAINRTCEVNDCFLKCDRLFVHAQIVSNIFLP